jgi:putative transposase
MIVQKTIRAKVVSLTRLKNDKLQTEYGNFQLALAGKTDVSLYSTTKQQAQRLLKRIKGEMREQPLIIRRDLFKIQKQETKVARWWARIPVFKKSIWVPVELPKNQEPLLRLDIRECRLVKELKNWSLRITVRKETIALDPKNVLAIDLGEKHIATTVLLRDGAFVNPSFYGERVRGLRRHYAWLRKRLGEKKALDTIRKIKDSERRKVNDILHKISKQIVDEALLGRACIVLGDLKGIRKRSRGRKMNRIVANMPYFKLSSYITYKASWAGVPVYKIKEARTSKTCHKCGQIGERLSQGLFKCHSCGLIYNADLNGAINIAKRFSNYMSENGASLAEPMNFPRVK